MNDYMRIFHLEALADLKGYNYKSTESSENPEKHTDFKLMVFKHQLKLEAQMEIHEDQKGGNKC
jgi:hypothetical protein